MSRNAPWVVASILLLAAFPAEARAQGLVSDALSSFPADTIHLEYSRPQTLRTLPNYNDLRARYIGPSLRNLESSLAQLGIEEGQIDELALGWQEGGSGMELYGLASGQFNLQNIAKSAQRRGIAPDPVGGSPAYCVGAGLGTVCALMLSPTRGAFGTLATLSEIMDVRHSAKPSLGSDPDFAKLIAEAQEQAPIWGVAEGAAAVDWFKGWMPSQQNVQLDWSKVFSGVASLAYSITAGDSVELGLKLDCKSNDDAASLRQVFEGLKLVQQLAWQNQNPNQQNPFQTMQVELQDAQVRVQLAASYSELEKLQTSGEPAQ